MLGEEPFEFRAGESVTFGYFTRVVGDGDFEDVLCQIDGYNVMIHEDSSFQEIVTALRHYDALSRRSPFHHLQLTVLSVTALAGGCGRTAPARPKGQSRASRRPQPKLDVKKMSSGNKMSIGSILESMI